MRITGTVAALAAVLALPAAAPVPAPMSPACALLTAEEAALVVGGAATIQDGGPEASGVSGCAWTEPARLAAVSVQVIGGTMFSSAGTDATSYYEMVVQGMRNAGLAGEDIPGAGEKAYLVAGGTPEAQTFTLTLLKGEKIATVTTNALARDQAIAAAMTIADRL